MKSILLALSLLTLAGCGACDDEAGSQRALQAQGFTNVQFHGHAFWGCSKGDNSAIDFTATNPLGQPVAGTVCCGGKYTLNFKGCTVRF